MGFPGKDKMRQDQSASGGSGWVKLLDDQPLQVTILGYVGTTASKKYPDKTQYRFSVAQDGVIKKLDCNWRLMRALTEQIEQLDSAFVVTITQKKVIAEIDGKKQLVNDYTLTNVKPVDSVSDVPF